MKLYSLCIAIALLSICNPVIANAGTVDLTPVVNYGLDIIGQSVSALAMVIVSAVGAFVARKFKIDGDLNIKAEAEATLEKGILMAVNYAKTKAKDKAKVQVDNVFVKVAVEYLLPKIPNALKKLGITPDGLAQRIEARAEELLDTKSPIGF